MLLARHCTATKSRGSRYGLGAAPKRKPTVRVPRCGTIQCVRGRSTCVAVAGKDYCNQCGCDCGGCFGHCCSTASGCSPGQLCVNYRLSLNAVQRWQCRSLGSGCTEIPNLCWTKGEVGIAQLGCIEGFPIVLAKFKLLRNYTFFHNEF